MLASRAARFFGTRQTWGDRSDQSWRAVTIGNCGPHTRANGAHFKKTSAQLMVHILRKPLHNEGYFAILVAILVVALVIARLSGPSILHVTIPLETSPHYCAGHASVFNVSSWGSGQRQSW